MIMTMTMTMLMIMMNSCSIDRHENRKDDSDNSHTTSFHDCITGANTANPRFITSKIDNDYKQPGDTDHNIRTSERL